MAGLPLLRLAQGLDEEELARLNGLVLGDIDGKRRDAIAGAFVFLVPLLSAWSVTAWCVTNDSVLGRRLQCVGLFA